MLAERYAGVAFQEHNTSLFNRLTASQFTVLGKALEQHFPTNAMEIRSLSADFMSRGHYVSYEYLAAWVYYHELAHTQLASNATAGRNNARYVISVPISLSIKCALLPYGAVDSI